MTLLLIGQALGKKNQTISGNSNDIEKPESLCIGAGTIKLGMVTVQKIDSLVKS